MTNVDPTEIGKFARLAARWWDPSGEFKTLHDINPLRLDYIDRWAPLAGATVLDVGCGGGLLSEAMAQRGARVTGIDMGAVPLRVAELHRLESGIAIDYRQTSAEQLAAASPEQFDTVVCMELLEHVPDPASLVSACARLVRGGGHVFFSTLNRNPKSYVLAILGAEYILRMLPQGTHDFARFVRPAELLAWVRRAQLRVLDLTGLSYCLLTRTYRLVADDVSVNYLVACRRVARF